jgi:LysR family transcriptional regulator, low CO2-responsive transcriptional regulator
VLRLVTISAGNFFVPRLAGLFRQRHPGVALHLLVHQQNEVLRLLQDNEADFAIMGRPPAQPDFVGTPFAPHPYGFIAHPGHALCGARDIHLDALRGETLITRQRGSDNRRIWDELMEKRSVPLPVGAEAASNEMLKEMAAAGLGIGWVSLHAVTGDLAQGQLRTLDIAGFPLMRRWYLVRHRDKAPGMLSKAFAEFLLHEGGDFVNTLIRDPGLKRKVQQAVQARERKVRGDKQTQPRPRKVQRKQG